jgi:hypothetical protein
MCRNRDSNRPNGLPQIWQSSLSTQFLP